MADLGKLNYDVEIKEDEFLKSLDNITNALKENNKTWNELTKIKLTQSTSKDVVASEIQSQKLLNVEITNKMKQEALSAKISQDASVRAIASAEKELQVKIRTREIAEKAANAAVVGSEKELQAKLKTSRAEERTARDKLSTLAVQERLTREILKTTTAQASSDTKSAVDTEKLKAAKVSLLIIQEKLKTQASATSSKQVIASTKEQFATEQLSAAKSRAATAEVRLNNAKRAGAKATNTSTSAYNKQALVLQNLHTAASSYLSLFAVARIIGKIREVTGEFELQNKALAAIIQNKERADQLFNEVTDLALKSPFAIKELLTYTKSLAAYRIETEQLIPTLSKLGDISAGLGVSMDRLILAYGQVKAASVLRGQELRQFTEAGIPLVSLLADKFTELEGRVVSTSDVFDKISKRMVSFGMVSEIFEDMTKKGGMFFEAQKVQAETIAGLWNIMFDAFDKMYNAIGSANEDTIKGGIKWATEMTNNWESVVAILKQVLIAYGAFKTAMLVNLAVQKVIKSMTISQAVALEMVTKAQRAQMIGAQAVSNIGKSIAANLGTISLVGISLLAGYFYEAYQEAYKLDRELESIFNQGKGKADSMATDFKKLADAATEAASGSHNQREALAALNREFKEYLPNQITTIENLKAMKGNYNAVTDAINLKIEAQTREKLQNTINSKFQEEGAKAAKSFIAALVDSNKFSQADAEAFVATIRSKYEEATKKGVSFNFGKELNKGLAEFLETDLIDKWGVNVISNISKVQDTARDFLTTFKELNEEQEKIKGVTFALFKDGGRYASEIKSVRSVREEYKKLNEALNNEANLSKDDKIIKETKLKKEELNKLITTYNNLAASSSKASEEGKKIYYLREAEGYAEQLKALTVDLSIYQQVRKNIIKDVVSSNKIDVSIGKLFEIGADESVSGSQKKIIDNYKELIEDVSQYEKTLKIARAQELEPALIKTKEQELAIIRDKLTVVKAIINAEGLSVDKKGGVDNTALDNLKAQLDLLEKIKKSREDLSKILNSSDVEKNIQAIFGEQAKDLKVKIPITSDTDAFYKQMDDIANASEKLGTKAGIIYAKALRTKIATNKADDVVKEVEKALKNIDNEISNYKSDFDLYKDILGITADEEIAIKIALDGEDAKKKFSDTLKKIVEANYGKGLSFGDMFAQIKTLPTEIAKQVRAVADIIDKETNDALISRMKLQYSEFAEGMGFEFDFSNIISKLKKEVTSAKADLVFALSDVTASDTDRDTIKKNTDLSILSINEIARQRIEKLSSVFIKEQLQIKGLENAYSNMTDASLEDINKIIKVLSESQNNLFTESGIKDVLKGSDLGSIVIDDIFGKVSESNNLRDFRDAIEDITSKLKDGDNVSLSGKVYSEEDIRRIKLAAEAYRVLIEGLIGAKEAATKMKLQKQASEWKQLQSEISDVVDSTVELGEVFGISLGEDGKKALEGLKAASIGVIGVISGTAILAASAVKGVEKASVILAVIGAVLAVIQAVASVVKSIFNDDDERQKDIEREQERINNLEQAYKKLGWAMADAMGQERTINFNTQVQNLNKQVDSLRKQADAERRKKDSDKDKITEYGNKVDDVKQKIKELNDEWAKGKIGTDLVDAANQFANAMLDAFLGAEDASEAFSTNFKDMMRRALLESFKTQVLMSLLEPLLKQMRVVFAPETSQGSHDLNKQIVDIERQLADAEKKAANIYNDTLAKTRGNTNAARKEKDTADAEVARLKALLAKAKAELADLIGNGEISEEQLQELVRLGEITQAEADLKWKTFQDLLTRLGLGADEDTGELSGLAKGIQGVTEDTSRRLEALLNSMRERGLVDSAKISNIMVSIKNTENYANQIASSSAATASNTSKQLAILNSVLANSNGTGGAGLKVYIQ